MNKLILYIMNQFNKILGKDINNIINKYLDYIIKIYNLNLVKLE